MKVENAEQQYYLLRSELESKIKNTCIRFNYHDVRKHTTPKVLSPVLSKQIQPSAKVPTGHSRKRVQQSPLSKTGVTPPSKCPTTSIKRGPLQPLASSALQQSGVTPPSKCPPLPIVSVTRRPLQLIVPRETTTALLPPHTAAAVTQPLRRELFSTTSDTSTTTSGQLFQEEINIPVYTDLESDPDEDIKVSTYVHNFQYEVVMYNVYIIIHITQIFSQVVVANNPQMSRVLPDSIKEIGKALLCRSDIVEAVLKCVGFN